MYKTIVVKSLQRARRNITKDFYSKSLFNYKTIPTVQPISKEYGLVSNIMKSGSFYQFLVDSHKECGDVITFNLFDRSSISINHPELFSYEEGDILRIRLIIKITIIGINY